MLAAHWHASFSVFLAKTALQPSGFVDVVRSIAAQPSGGQSVYVLVCVVDGPHAHAHAHAHAKMPC